MATTAQEEIIEEKAKPDEEDEVADERKVAIKSKSKKKAAIPLLNRIYGELHSFLSEQAHSLFIHTLYRGIKLLLETVRRHIETAAGNFSIDLLV
jgi:hypothetical protein